MVVKAATHHKRSGLTLFLLFLRTHLLLALALLLLLCFAELLELQLSVTLLQ